MTVNTERLITIANELKTLDQQRERLLAELQGIARGISAGASVAARPGRPPASPAQSKPVAPVRGRKRRKGLTTDIVAFLKSGGGAYTAGEIVAGLKRPKTKSQISSVSTTLVRLAREGRARKDKERGYRAA